MNMFMKLLITYFFIFGIFSAKIINIENNDFIKQKLTIWGYVSLFHIIITFISRIISGCKLDITNTVTTRIKNGLYAIIGYSLYQDLASMDKTYETFDGLNKNIKGKMIISLIIILFMTVANIFELIFSKNIDC